MNEKIKIGASVLATIVSFICGLDIAIKSLVIVLIIDYITGVMSAYYNKKLDSKIGLKGIIKKFAYLLVVTLAFILDNLTGKHGLIKDVVIYFFIANDGLSILENVAKMNVPIPKRLKDALLQLKESDLNDNNK